MTIKLTKRQQQVIDRALETPIVEVREASGCVTFHFVDGGNIRSDVVKRLIDAKCLKASGDGLFPGFSQTWVA